MDNDYDAKVKEAGGGEKLGAKMEMCVSPGVAKSRVVVEGAVFTEVNTTT